MKDKFIARADEVLCPHHTQVIRRRNIIGLTITHTNAECGLAALLRTLDTHLLA